MTPLVLVVVAAIATESRASGTVRPMSRLAGKVAIITGASSGLGRVGAERFAAEGAKVVIADIVDGDEAVEAIAEAGGEASFVRCDVTDDASMKKIGRAHV